MTEKDDGVLLELLPRLARLSNAVNRGGLYERAIASTGVTLERPALTVLVTVRSAGRPMRIGEIAGQMQVEGPHVTRLAQSLEKRGLLERVTDPDDGRARLAALTPDGEAVAERYLGVVLGWFGAAMADWSTQDRRDLNRLLGRMFDDLSGYLDRIADE